MVVALETEVAGAQARQRELELRLAEAERERDRIAERARQLSDAASRIHATLFRGSVPEMVLRASLGLTGATRGAYVSARDGRLHVRVAIGFPSYQKGRPSPRLEALCRIALDHADTFLCSDVEALNAPPPEPLEQVRNCAVVPVSILKNLDGVIVIADKQDGDFCEGDVEALLTIGDQARVALTNARLERELESAYLATVSMLADVVEAKDPYTRGHCEAASRLARVVGREMGLDGAAHSSLCYAALLHDVGKIGITDGVLNKPGALLPEERKLVEAHVRIGYDLIRSVAALDGVAEIVLHHHEHFDGGGYPDGQRGEEISMGSRIIAVVDAYCAMVDVRSYKPAMSKDDARAELARCAGSQFDPAVVSAFLRTLDTPAALDQDDDDAAECGPFPRLLEAQRRNLASVPID